MKLRYLILVLSIISCSEDSEEPKYTEGDKILIAFQNTRKVYYFLQDSQKFYFLFNSGDVPNQFILGDNEIFLINSGGFTGSPSIQRYNLIDNSLRTFPLDNALNPLFGIYDSGKLYFTDFGKFYSEKVYAFKDQLIDSLVVSNRPIDIKLCDNFLIVSTNGMKEDYSYDTISKVFKISKNLQKIDSLIVYPGASNIEVVGNIAFLVSTGIYNQTPARIYKIDCQNFRKIDSVTISKNIYSSGISSQYLILGSWDGWIYVLNHNLNILDSLKISHSINFIHSFGNRFYITANGFSHNPNYIIIYGPFVKADSFKFSDEDLGVGPLFYLKQIIQ